jgi:hypothetical protein
VSAEAGQGSVPRRRGHSGVQGRIGHELRDARGEAGNVAWLFEKAIHSIRNKLGDAAHCS